MKEIKKRNEEQAKKNNPAAAMEIDNMDIVEELALPPVKIHC